MKEQIWVLVDVSYLAYRARHTMGHLSHGDIRTGVIYGFFEELYTVCMDPRVQSNRVALFFDSAQSYRKEEFSWYKEHRQTKRTPEELAELTIMHEQLKLLKNEMLPAMGLPTYRQTGLESDDLLAQCAKQLDASGGRTRQAVMVTSDRDLWQSIYAGTVDWFDPARDLLLNHMDLYAKVGVEPSQWADVKAYGGCTSDEVPGVPGVGEKTAIDYVTGVLNPKYKRAQAIVSKEGMAIYRRNLSLVRLPHAMTRPVELVEPAYNPAVFFVWCEKLGLKSYLGDRRLMWERFFRGEMMGEQQQRARKRGER